MNIVPASADLQRAGVAVLISTDTAWAAYELAKAVLTRYEETGRDYDRVLRELTEALNI